MYEVTRATGGVVYRAESLTRVREWLAYAAAEYPAETFAVYCRCGGDLVHVSL